MLRQKSVWVERAPLSVVFTMSWSCDVLYRHEPMKQDGAGCGGWGRGEEKGLLLLTIRAQSRNKNFDQNHHLGPPIPDVTHKSLLRES